VRVRVRVRVWVWVWVWVRVRAKRSTSVHEVACGRNSSHRRHSAGHPLLGSASLSGGGPPRLLPSHTMPFDLFGCSRGYG